MASELLQAIGTNDELVDGEIGIYVDQAHGFDLINYIEIFYPVDTGEWATFVLFVITHDDGGGANATLDLKLQHSPDGRYWADLYEFPQITTAVTHVLSVPSTGDDINIKTWARFVRLVGKLGGVDDELDPVAFGLYVKYSGRRQ